MKLGPYKISRHALPIFFVFALAGCSYFDDVLSVFDWDESTPERSEAQRSASDGADTSSFFDDVLSVFGWGEPTPEVSANQGVRERSEAQRSASDGADTPSLASVPSRPEAPASSNRERVVEGLISDRGNARYTDDAIRLQGSTRAPAVSRSASAPVVIPAPAKSLPQPTIVSRPSTSPARAAVAPAPIAPPPSAAPVVQVERSSASGPTPQASGAVIVDMSIFDGGYVPTSARLAPNTQVATIQFGHSSAQLNARDLAIIDTVATAQRTNGSNVLVVGHASSRTLQMSRLKHKLVNFQVSLKRANAVAQALIESGVPSKQVTVEAVSDHQPVFAESMPNGEAGNRRTEIFFLR